MDQHNSIEPDSQVSTTIPNEIIKQAVSNTLLTTSASTDIKSTESL